MDHSNLLEGNAALPSFSEIQKKSITEIQNGGIKNIRDFLEKHAGLREFHRSAKQVHPADSVPRIYSNKLIHTIDTKCFIFENDVVDEIEERVTEFVTLLDWLMQERLVITLQGTTIGFEPLSMGGDWKRNDHNLILYVLQEWAYRYIVPTPSLKGFIEREFVPYGVFKDGQQLAATNHSIKITRNLAIASLVLTALIAIVSTLVTVNKSDHSKVSNGPVATIPLHTHEVDYTVVRPDSNSSMRRTDSQKVDTHSSIKQLLP